MKLSISLPDPMAQEIRALSKETERNVSWWIQKAWETARVSLLRVQEEAEASHRKFLGTLDSLKGALKDEYPGVDSVTLSHRAFEPRK